MTCNEIVTICLSIFAIIISCVSISVTLVLNKYKIFLQNKEIIVDSFIKYNKQVVYDWSDSKSRHFINKSSKEEIYSDLKIIMQKNATNLDSTLNLLFENLIENKYWKKTIFFCHKCLNFYKTDALKLMMFTIASEWNEIIGVEQLILKSLFTDFKQQDQKQNVEFLNKFNQKFLMHYEFFARTYFVNFWKKTTRKQANRGFVLANLFGLEEETFEEFLLGLEDDLEFTNFEDKKNENIQIAKNILNRLTDDHKFVSEFRNKVSDIGLFYSSMASDDEYFNKKLFDFIKIIRGFLEMQPINYNQIIKNRNKVSFSIFKCHYCIISNWNSYIIKDFPEFKK